MICFIDKEEDMDTEALKTFITLAKLRNFTKTAQQHFVVQSTVTNRIMELEKEIGKPLFLRDRKSVTLTPEGEHLLAYAVRITQLEEAAINELSALNTFLGVLRIGSVNTVYDCHLSPYIAAYMKSHKDIAVNIIINHSNELLRMLKDDTIDVCFSYIPMHSTQFECITFRTDELILVTSPSHNRYPSGIRKSELIGLDYLYCDYVIDQGKSLIRDMFPKNFPFAFEVDNGTKLLPFLVEGLGYSYVPRSLIQTQLSTSQLVEVKSIDFDTPKIHSYISIHKKRLESQAISDWMGIIKYQLE